MRAPFNLRAALDREISRWWATLYRDSHPEIGRFGRDGGDLCAAPVWYLDHFCGYVVFSESTLRWGYQAAEAPIVWIDDKPEGEAPDLWAAARCVAG